MKRHSIGLLALAAAGILAAGHSGSSQGRGPLSPEMAAQRRETEKALESIAIIERKLMVPMRDGKRMAAE